MPYEDILKRAEGHMTKKYDEQFQAVPDLKWSPWVGKNYHKTGILILGMSTHQNNDGDWTKDSGRDASRTFFDFDHENCTEHGAFSNTSKMFLDGAGVALNQHSHSGFWESVAFNNYYQVAVPERGASPECADDIEGAKNAFFATIKIIKPKLVVVWGVTLAGDMGLPNVEKRQNNIGSRSGAYPMVFVGDNETPPIVWIQHPSALVGDNHQDQWFEFLLSDPASKQPVEDFLQYLKQQPSN